MITSIPSIIHENPADYDLNEGVFYSLPPDLFNKNNVIRLIAEHKIGHWTCAHGHKHFSGALPDNKILTFPYILNVTGKFGHKKNLASYYSFESDHVEEYFKSIKNDLESKIEKNDDKINTLIHDLRNISNTIYNSALEAKTYTKIRNWEKAQEKIDSVIANQSMLKIRTDLLDYSGNPASLISHSNIPVFKRIHKVIRVFRSKAFSKNINIFLKGKSHNLCSGPDILEMIPYVLLDNAIKYSPLGRDIIVKVSDKNKETEILVKSFGPKISNDEKFKIFERFYRAESAKLSLKPGSGIGLNVAKTLIENQFGGVITVDQDINNSILDRNGVSENYLTTFTVLIPTFKG